MAEETGRLRTLGGHFAKPFVAYGRYTKAAFGTEQVKANWRDIGLLWDAVRGRHEAPPPPAAPLHALDLRTPRVQAALWRTAWACRVHTATAGLVFWAWTAPRGPRPARVAAAVEFLARRLSAAPWATPVDA